MTSLLVDHSAHLDFYRIKLAANEKSFRGEVGDFRNRHFVLDVAKSCDADYLGEPSLRIDLSIFVFRRCYFKAAALHQKHTLTTRDGAFGLFKECLGQNCLK